MVATGVHLLPEHADDGLVPIEDGNLEGRLSIPVAQERIRPRIQQTAHQSHASPQGCQMQDIRELATVSRKGRIRPQGEEELGSLAVIMKDG